MHFVIAYAMSFKNRRIKIPYQKSHGKNVAQKSNFPFVFNYFFCILRTTSSSRDSRSLPTPASSNIFILKKSWYEAYKM